MNDLSVVWVIASNGMKQLYLFVFNSHLSYRKSKTLDETMMVEKSYDVEISFGCRNDSLPSVKR